MLSVNIADLKNRLSMYLQQVRSGEEIVVRDRNLPVAKLVPFRAADTSAEELALAANGELSLPSQTLDEESFWNTGAELACAADLTEALSQAVNDEREERDAGLLGR